MNTLLNGYFHALENKLLADVKVARTISTNPVVKGEAGEAIFGRLLSNHLPARARIAIKRQIVGADSNSKVRQKGSFSINENRIDEGPSDPVDLIVYNEWTTTPNLLNVGYILVESVYLTLEVKCSGSWTYLRRNLLTGSKQLVRTKLRRRLRPETLYVGNVRRPNDLPINSLRTGRPTSCLVGLLWSDDSAGNPDMRCKRFLGSLVNTVQKWKGCTARHNRGRTVRHPWHYPDVIYVPQQFLAFKIFSAIEEKSGGWVETPVQRSEYPFLTDTLRKKDGSIWDIMVDIGGSNEFTGYRNMRYGYCLHQKDGVNLLYIFLSWLSQEILKFIYEVPDYHRYLFNEKDSRLHERHAAGIAQDGRWGRYIYRDDKWDEG